MYNAELYIFIICSHSLNGIIIIIIFFLIFKIGKNYQMDQINNGLPFLWDIQSFMG